VRRVRLSRVAAVVLVALFGLVLAAAVTYAASTIVSQPIGLASEPADIGESLGPRPFVPSAPPRTITRTTTVPTPGPSSTTTTFTPATTPTGTGSATTAPSTGNHRDPDESGAAAGRPDTTSPGSPGYTGRGDGDD
jgi:hypothetical protein